MQSIEAINSGYFQEALQIEVSNSRNFLLAMEDAKICRYQSDLKETLGPILKILRTIGSWPRDGNQFILRLNAWNGLTLFILHFYTVHKFLNWMTLVKSTENMFDVFQQLTTISRTAITAITFDLRFARHFQLTQMFEEIEEFPTFNEEYRVSNIRRMVKGLLVGCSIFVLLHFVLASALMFHANTASYVNWMFYGDATENTHDAIIRVIMIADWALYLFLVICNECSTTALYITICLALRQKVRDYNQFLLNVEAKKLATTAHQVQELYKLSSRLSSIVGRFEENMGLPVFLWTLCIVFNLCIKIEAIVTGIKGAEFEEFGYIVIDVIYYVMSFISITLVASEIGEQNNEAVLAVTKIAEDGDPDDWTFQQETQLLLIKLNTRMMRLTGWKCFELNKSFMLTILGALATYTIIILQMG